MDTTPENRFSRPTGYHDERGTPEPTRVNFTPADNKKHHLASTPEAYSSSDSPSPYPPELGTPCPRGSLSRELFEGNTPNSKRSRHKTERIGAYSVYKSHPHHAVIVDGDNGGELIFVNQAAIQQGHRDSDRYRHLASKSLLGGLIPISEELLRQKNDSKYTFARDQSVLHEYTLGQGDGYQSQLAYSCLRDVPLQATSSTTTDSPESSAAGPSFYSTLATTSSTTTSTDLSEAATMALSNDNNRASFQYVQPETIFTSLEHDMKVYPSVDDSEQLWRMGVQLGIGAAINAYRKVLGTSTVSNGTLPGLPEGATQQDLCVAALAAQDIQATREMVVDAVHSSGLDSHMQDESGFAGTNKMMESPRVIDDGEMAKDPMPSMKAFRDAKKPVPHTAGSNWDGGIEMTQLDGGAGLAAQAWRDHEMTEAEMSTYSIQ